MKRRLFVAATMLYIALILTGCGAGDNATADGPTQTAPGIVTETAQVAAQTTEGQLPGYNATPEDGSDIPPQRTRSKANDATNFALSKLGAPYRYGASGNREFDCSSLIQWAFSMVGIRLPRVAADQARSGTYVGRKDLRFGDLVFFATGSDPRSVTHVGIYIGDNKFVDANSVAGKVVIDNLTYNYWNQRFLFGRRVS